jgi:predicted RNA polymerase sigma factor
LRLFTNESGRGLATLVRPLGDLDLAEEAMREAFAAALDEALAWAKKAAIACDVPSEVRELLFYPTPEQGRDGSK